LSQGRLVVISGPSGVGKGTVIRRLLQLRPDLALSVSATTRAARPGEVDGREYYFMDDDEFDTRILDGAFLEWAPIYGHRSGTLRSEVDRLLAEGRRVLLEIDIQGASWVHKRVAAALLIFLRPPSEAELARRLTERHTESGEALALRLQAARSEIAQAPWFDRAVVNDDVDRAASEVAAIIDGVRGDTPAGPRPT